MIDIDSIPEERKFEMYKDLFSTEGYKLFVATLKADSETLMERMTQFAVSNEELRYYQGRIAQCNIIINLENMIELASKQEVEVE
jgi:hypothetical protein